MTASRLIVLQGGVVELRAVVHPGTAGPVKGAKAQLSLMLDEMYLHPNGQIPAYEWNFGDVNPPVHALATMYVYRMEME